MKRTSIKKVFSVVIILTVIVSSLIFIFLPIARNTSHQTHWNLPQNYSITSSSLSEESFTPILEEEKSGVGTVTILNISYQEEGFTNYSSAVQYKELNDDISLGALNVTYNSTQFINTLVNATGDYLTNSFSDQNKILIRLNESLQIEFDNSTSDVDGLAGYLIYLPRLTPIDISEIYIDNTKLEEEDYAIKNIDSYPFIYFNYYNYFGELSSGTFIMDILFTYNITLNDWEATQGLSDDLTVSQQTENITAEYEYFFEIVSKHYTGQTSIGSIMDASDLYLNLKVIPFDRNQLTYTSLQLNGVIKNINQYSTDNIITINVSDSFTANKSQFLLDFSSEFTVHFYKALDNTWAIDRLVEQFHIRERIYFPSIIDGPSHLIVRCIIFEPSISTNEMIDSYTQFERDISRITGEKGGLTITSPVLIRGELACPFVIKYQAINNFQITIKDNFDVPLSGLTVELYYHNKMYGTYISKGRVQPLGPISTDQNGQINLAFLPKGIYAIGIYKNGDLEAVKFLNTIQPVYSFTTEIPHIPIVVIIFGSISIAIILIGIVYYLKSNKKR
ncbi:MAG: conserved exported protein of unknown function [Promethearchaeota archaeon]|nr:MAG: conserved exported protein of unknown function [Candidatus Lokiarchaeota archaeon]